MRIDNHRRERGMKEAKEGGGGGGRSRRKKWEEGGKKRIPLRERAGPTALKRIVGRGTER